jgi:hypothetical protein
VFSLASEATKHANIITAGGRLSISARPKPDEELAVSKAKDTKKDVKKAATKTPKEKKEAKKLKKEERKRQ